MKHTIRIRGDQLDVARRAAGLESNRSLAGAMGVNPSTLGRALNGETQVGGEVIAGLLAAFSGLRFEDLFSLEETDEDADEPELARVG